MAGIIEEMDGQWLCGWLWNSTMALIASVPQAASSEGGGGGDVGRLRGGWSGGVNEGEDKKGDESVD